MGISRIISPLAWLVRTAIRIGAQREITRLHTEIRERDKLISEQAGENTRLQGDIQQKDLEVYRAKLELSTALHSLDRAQQILTEQGVNVRRQGALLLLPPDRDYRSRAQDAEDSPK